MSHSRMPGISSIASASRSIAQASKKTSLLRSSRSPGANRVRAPSPSLPHPDGPKKPIVSFLTQYRCQ